MSGFGFGGFDFSNISENFGDIGDRLQKLKEDVEQTIDASLKEESPEGGIEEDESWFGGLDNIVKTFVADEEEEEQVGEQQEEEAEEENVEDSSTNGREEIKVNPLPIEIETSENVAEAAQRLEEEQKPIASEVTPNNIKDVVAKEQSGSELKQTSNVQESKPSQNKATAAPQQQEGKQSRKSKKGGKKKKGAALNTVKECKESNEFKSSEQSRIQDLERTLEQREEQLKRQAELLHEAESASHAATQTNENAQRLQNKLEEMEKLNKKLMEEKMALENKAKAASTLQQQIKTKDAEIQEILQEGEALSKKQLQMETLVKQLRIEVSSLQDQVDRQETTITADKAHIAALEQAKEDLESMVETSKDNQNGLVQILKSEHEKTIKELRTELIAAERKMENMEKSGASRKLRDAESKCEALQASIESIRDEMRRQRQNADEREDMLSAEISVLQEACSEAEVRQQDFENKLKLATSPLLAEIDVLREKIEEQEQRSIASEKRFVDQIAKLEAEKQDIVTKLERLRESEEEARIRSDGLQSQLVSAQQSSVESERIASEAKSARDKADVLLREAKSELAAIEKSSESTEKLFYSQLEAMTSKESTLKETIRGLEDDVRVLTQKLDEAHARQSTAPRIDAAPVPVNDFSTPIDESEDGVRRKIKELESTRDHLSDELVKAEQKLAEANAARVLLNSQNKEISDLRKKLAAATELLGEKEERLEELRADLEDMREGYKQQLVIMADEVARLTKKEKVVEEFLS